MLRFLIVAACASMAYAGLQIESCESGAPMASEVLIDGCDAVPCYLERGTDALAYISFQARKSILFYSNLKILVIN
jgi:hypothetical protein